MANEETLTMAMIEGAVAVANLESILDVPGVDLVFVGPYDLSQALGVPAKLVIPWVMEAMNEIVKQAQAARLRWARFRTMQRQLCAGQKLEYSSMLSPMTSVCYIKQQDS